MRTKATTTAIVCSGLAVFFWLYRVELGNTLFYDEWMYVVELGNVGYSPRWILAPTEGHFTPLHKGLFFFFLRTFGLNFMPLHLFCLLLYAGVGLALFALTAELAGTVVARYIFLAYLTTAAFSEAGSWSVHLRMLLYVLALLGWLLCLVPFTRADDHRQTLRRLLVANGCFLLMSYSLSTIVFSAILFVAFAIVCPLCGPRRHAVVFSHAAQIGVSMTVYFAYVHDLLRANYQKTGVLELDMLERVLGSVQGALVFFVEAVVLRLLNVHFIAAPGGPLKWIATIVGGLLILGLAGFAIRSRTQRGLSMFLLFMLSFFLFAQIFYRTSLEFLLQWNKYGYMPGVVLLALLASLVGARSARNSKLSHALAASYLAANVAFGMHKIPEAYGPLLRDNQVSSYVADVRKTFEGLRPAALYDLALESPLLIPGYPLPLSALFELSTTLRDQPVEFFAAQTLPTQEQRAHFETLLGQEPTVLAFYERHHTQSFEAPVDALSVAPKLTKGIVYVQEIALEPLGMARLFEASLLVGTYAKVNTNTNRFALLTESGELLERGDIPSTTMLNNAYQSINLRSTKNHQKRVFFAAWSDDGTEDNSVSIYQTQSQRMGKLHRISVSSGEVVDFKQLLPRLSETSLVKGNLQLRLVGQRPFPWER